MYLVGIDPGLSGAIALAGPDNVSAWDMPLLNDGTKKQLDLLNIIDLLKSFPETSKVVLEKAQPMPRDGSMGSFRYGEVYGALKALIVSMKLPLIEVAPITWKTKIVGKGKDKDASRMLVMQLFPQLSKQFQIKKSHNRAEAILLTEYGKRFLF